MGYEISDMLEPELRIARLPALPMNRQTDASPSTAGRVRPSNWVLSISSLLFIVLQSMCTAVMAISSVRVLIGLSALAAAAGLNRPAWGYHADAIRIPMMTIAVVGSVVNLYVVWRIRSLRNGLRRGGVRSR